MLFNSFSYVLFLWAVFVLFWTWRTKRKLRYSMVLIASYWFYGQSHWGYVSLLAISTVVDFIAGASIQKAHDREDSRSAKLWLWVSLLVNLGLLGTFKYFDFFVGSVEALLGEMGVDASFWRLNLILPVGISFYTFQTLSYSIDIYRRQMKPTKSFLDFAVYVAFFPQLVAGPIVRAIDFIPQMANPAPPTRMRIGQGTFLILQGLTKKLLIADLLATQFIDPTMADPARLEALGGMGVIVLGMGFLLQVYGDFCGYSDIAIGSAKVLGFELRPNFDMPFGAITLDKFWQRWHISMSSWFRDYVYIGLGGSRKGPYVAMWNNFVTLLIVGLWHGSSWNYVIFGGLHGIALAGTRMFRMVFGTDARWAKTFLWGAFGWFLTQAFTAVTILMYRTDTMDDWYTLVGQMGDVFRLGARMPDMIWLLYAVALATHMTPQKRCDQVRDGYARLPMLVQAAIMVGMMILLFGLRPPGTVPFYYFQF